MNQTRIEWADVTWNPITGCTPISEGCEHCYAARMAKRLAGRFGYPKDDPFRVTFHPDRLTEPLHWKKPRKIFVCSMGDLFHEDVKPDWIDRILSIIRRTPQHTYMVLTKRAVRMMHYMLAQWPPPPRNMWLGVTAENQRTANERIPLLLDTPAALRFVSVEPMLSAVDLNERELLCHTWRRGLTIGIYLDWVICGAETGPGARSMNYNWGRELHDQCQSVEIPFFFKKGNGGEQPPADLLVRQWPSLTT